MFRAIRQFALTQALRLGLNIIQTYPRDMTADNQALFGLMGFWKQANNYAERGAAVTTAGTDTAISADNILRGVIVLASGASGGFTITLPTTALILAAFGPTLDTKGGFAKVLRIKNNGVGQTGTVTAGDASTTLTGTMTIATNTTRTFLMTVTGPTTVTIENLGSMAL